ncbi:MAG: glutamate--tRNA ligase [Candidatus Kapabacteria bacterium]|nr:glutamate--tRNA ligase [Candidatus Kapabacteria bacterium]
MSVRVRFAPSPTGFLHIGSLRTALYNYLFAKHHGGTCILRIEDTDRTRFVEGAIEEQISSLAWAGVTFDEGPHVGGNHGPYTQSERFDMYREYGMKLVVNGTAYYAFDTAEELDAMRVRQQAAGIAPKYDRSAMRNQYTLGEQETQRLLSENAPHVIRLKVPLHQDVRFSDEIRGEVIVNGREIDDQILLKSDGFPTYHLANVVDDHFMEITHVIRAEEWLPSTPKHIILYQAFGWEPPTFAHVPLLLNPDRSKMSKRHGDVMVRDFAKKGFFPEALVNFVALCGWNPGSDNEFYSMQELIDTFTLDRVNKAGAVFDYQKLNWMNGEYLKRRDVHDLARELHPVLVERGYTYIDPAYVAEVIELVRERVAFLGDIAEFADYLFGDTLEPLTETGAASLSGNDTLTTALDTFRQGLDAASLADADAFKGLAQRAAESAGIKMGAFMKPLRLVLTHREVGADLFRTVQLLGHTRCLARLNAYLSR